MVSDRDIELLEAHLDFELDPAESAALEQRLAAEPELRDRLQNLRQHRAARLAAFESWQPGEEETGLAIEALEASIARRTWFQSLVHSWPRLAVAAACIAMFATGMWMRDNLAGSGQVSSIRIAQPVGLPVSSGVNGRPLIEMRVLDPSGQPIDARAFSSIDAAEAYVGRLRLQRDLSQSR